MKDANGTKTQESVGGVAMSRFYDDDFEYDDFEDSHAPEYEYDCTECGAPCDVDGLCDDCRDPYEDYDPGQDCYYDDWDMIDPHSRGCSDFADPGGNSALRAATPDNPRNLPCPTCGRKNMLTPADRARGYQCDICADELERGY